MHTPGRGGAQAKLAPEIPHDAVAATVQPARVGPQAAAAGDSASPAAMQRLADALQTLKAQAVRPLLEQSMAAIGRDDWRAAADFAISALKIDERNGYGWWLLAIAREKAGDVRSALACYECALQLLPEHGEIANDLGRLAFQLGEKAVAAQLFQHFLAAPSRSSGRAEQPRLCASRPGPPRRGDRGPARRARSAPWRGAALEHARHHDERARRPGAGDDLLRRGAAPRSPLRQGSLQPRQRQARGRRSPGRPGRLRPGARPGPAGAPTPP